MAPVEDGAVFFTSGGSEAVDTAAKLVRRYWTVVGKPEKHILVVRDGAYHGMAGYGTSLGGIEPNLTGFGELLPGVVRLPPQDTAALARLLEERGAEVAGFFGEPVIGAGGVRPPAEGYWSEVPAPLPQARRPRGGRRGHHGLRPAGRVVRISAEWASSPISWSEPRASPRATSRSEW